MSTNSIGAYILTAENSKRGDPLCARPDDVERERWDRVYNSIKKRNILAKTAHILIDVVFGTLGIVAENERRYLLTGDSDLLPDDGVPKDDISPITDSSLQSSFFHSSGSHEPINTKDSAVRKDIEDTRATAKARIRQKKTDKEKSK